MLCEKGYIPSYCTACYRQGRTGDRFMSLAKSGEIQNVCLPNALLTFKEYLLDYADEKTTSALGDATYEKELSHYSRRIGRSSATAKRLSRNCRWSAGSYIFS